jgi:preprotein translocase subunit SecE
MQLFTYLKQVRAELEHVVWPTPRTGISHTLIIIGIGAFTAVFLGLLDYGFTHLVGTLLNG